jgi:integrase
MSVKLRKKKLKEGFSLYLDIHSKGKRWTEFLELHLKKDKNQNKEILRMAEITRARRELELHSLDKQIDINQSDVFFIPYLRKVGKSKPAENTRKNYEKTAKKLIEFWGNDKLTFRDIDKAFINRFKAFLMQKVSQNTACGYFSGFATVLAKAKSEKIIYQNPMDNVERLKQVQIIKEFLTLEELMELYKTECTHPFVKKIFLFECLTGLRQSDILKLRWKDIQYSEELGGYFIQHYQQKTSQPEITSISKQAYEILAEPNPNPEKYIFPFRHLEGFHGVHLKRWLLKAGITKNITFHCARHTNATLLLNNGADIFTVQKILGHTSIQSTLVYAKMVDKRKMDAVNALPDIRLSQNNKTNKNLEK